jgi:hypothetical protein
MDRQVRRAFLLFFRAADLCFAVAMVRSCRFNLSTKKAVRL